MIEENDGPDFEDGEEFEGYEDRAAETDEEAFVAVPEVEEEGTVVVQDYDPATPDAPLAEPQKVLVTNNRQDRKAAQRAPLDKS